MGSAAGKKCRHRAGAPHPAEPLGSRHPLRLQVASQRRPRSTLPEESGLCQRQAATGRFANTGTEKPWGAHAEQLLASLLRSKLISFSQENSTAYGANRLDNRVVRS